MKNKSLILVSALVIAGLIAAGCAQPAGDNKSAGTSAENKAKTIKLGHYGAVCEAPLFIAKEKDFFKNEGLDVELVKGDYETNKEGLATGKLDATDGVLQQWLKPTEQGLDLKFTTGIHTGCISLIAPANSAAKSIKDLKGKTIGVSGGIGGGPMNYVFRLLLQAGLNPQSDVAWKNYPGPQLETALEKGEIDAAVTGDTLAIGWVKKGKAKVIASMAKDAPFSNEICCLLGFNGKFLKDDQKSVTALTNAIHESAKWVAQNPDEAAKIMVEKQYILGTPELNAALLRDYKYEPGVEQGKQALGIAIKEFKQAGILGPKTNEEEVLKKVFVELPGVEK